MGHYSERLLAGEFLIQRCDGCKRGVFYPRVVCPHCGSEALKWERPSGRGTIYSSTMVRRPDSKGGPYNVVLVDLEEGVRLMSTVVDAAQDEIAIGASVFLQVATLEAGPAPVFRIAAGGRGAMS